MFKAFPEEKHVYGHIEVHMNQIFLLIATFWDGGMST